MATDRLANRWGIAVAAVIMQICLGAVYGWSVFVKTAHQHRALDATPRSHSTSHSRSFSSGWEPSSADYGRTA